MITFNKSLKKISYLEIAKTYIRYNLKNQLFLKQ